jgi:ferric-dicitrate binding protein FerR (iron transport regulator)
MKESFEKKLDFVVRHYKEGLFDTRKAIERLHGSFADSRPVRKWWSVLAAAAASVAVAFAAGYGIYSSVSDSSAPEQKPAATPAQTPPEAPAAHVFIFKDTPVAEVLKELGDYYGCTLSASPTSKHLTATFPEDDLDTILSVIESALDIDITAE